MLISAEVIEAYVGAIDGKEVNHPLLGIETLLFHPNAREKVKESLDRTYDFQTPGQVELWALDVQRQLIDLEDSICRVIHRMWRGDYEPFKDRLYCPQLLTALNFDAVVAALNICKILPHLYDGLVLPEEFKTVQSNMDAYLTHYNHTVVLPLTNAVRLYEEDIIISGIELVTFNQLIALLPTEVINHNPFPQMQIDLKYSYLPMFTLGVAIGNTLRVLAEFMSKLIVGGNKLIAVNDKLVKDHISVALRGLNYVSLEVLFFTPLTAAMTTGPEFLTDLHRTDTKFDRDLHSKWLDMVIPLGKVFTPEIVVSTATH